MTTTKSTAVPQCILHIEHISLLMPAHVGLKVAELLLQAVAVTTNYDSGITYTPYNTRAEVKYESMRKGLLRHAVATEKGVA
jgi:hypothetical protein